jgi:predicted acylesterase/phospholipase RssA/CRP-like cAMP-binding protein
VLALTRERLDGLLTTSPQLMAALSGALQERLRRAQIAGHLRDLFGEIEPAERAEIERRVRWVRLASGEELFTRGAPADGAYIVALGRLRVVVETDGRERGIDEIGPGEWVGEMALLTGKERSATVYALRDSELVWLPQSVFDDLICRRPKALLAISRLLVERLQRQMTQGLRKPGRGRKTLAVVPLGPGVEGVDWFVGELTGALSRYGSVLTLSAARVDAELGSAGIAASGPDEPRHLRLTNWLMEQEYASDYVLYQADGGWSEWTARALRHADHVLFVADGASRPAVGEAEAEFERRARGGRLPRQSLVLLQPGRRGSYPGTAAWLDRRAVDEHYHVRRGHPPDVARLGRILSGNASCFVFGGGGSRGYAHIGVVRALEAVGVPIDATGGASIGAVIATALGMEFNAAHMLEVVPPVMRSGFFNPTLPVVSMMSGDSLMQGIRRVVGDLNLEDLVLPVFAVSTNLTRGEEVIHRRGSIALALRSTGSVPGIFPPVPFGGDLLVDGGLSNNVPVGPMASLFSGSIIAVDVIPKVDLMAEGELPASLSGWRFAWQRLNPGAKPIGMPTILSVLMRSATCSSLGLRTEEQARLCALYLRPAVSRWNMMDFANAEPIAQEGYQGTYDAIRGWWEAEGPKILGRAAPALGVGRGADGAQRWRTGRRAQLSREARVWRSLLTMRSTPTSFSPPSGMITFA